MESRGSSGRSGSFRDTAGLPISERRKCPRSISKIPITFQVGKIPIRIGLEYHHTVIEPDDIPGTDYSVRFYIIPAAPSALFAWMQ